MTFSFHSCELDNDDALDQLGIRFRGRVQRGRGREEEEERGGGFLRFKGIPERRQPGSDWRW